MTVEPIGWVTLIVGLLGLYLERSFMVYAFFASTLLGAAAALIVYDLGGTTIQPAHLLLGFLSIKLISSRDIREGALRSINFGQPGFWLLLTVVYGAITAYLLPRFFFGETMTFIVRMRGESSAMPLVPSTSNLTQSVYFIGDFIAFVVVSGFGSSASGQKTLARAALGCVILNLFFVAADLITYFTNTTDIMQYIRNSTYSNLSDAELVGFKRIVGSFVEASSFGYWTLGYFAFSLTLWLNGIARQLTLSLSFLSLIALLFSTSTTAYVGLFGFLVCQYVATGFQLFRSARPQVASFVLAFPFITGLIVVLITLNDATAAYFGNILDTIVFNKLSTSSGIERSTWNSQAMVNFADTFGFGVGNGSLRTSSFPIAVLASLGIIGTVFYGLFLAKIWFDRNRPADPAFIAIQTAARAACLGWLIGVTVSGSFVDLGLPFFAFAALACASLPASRTVLAPLRTDHGINFLR